VKGIAIDMLGIMALAVLTMVVGAGFIQSMSMDVSKTLPAQMTKSIQDIVGVVLGEGDFSLCESLHGKKIKYGEFKTLLSTMLGGTCNQTQVQLDFSITEEDVDRIASEVGASDYLLANETEIVGGGLLIIRPNPGRYILKYDDVVNLTSGGKPKRDVMIVVAVPGCDPFDDVCELACSFKKGVCDPHCYRTGQHEDVPCDLDCVDTDRNGVIDKDDKDGVCDLDCYNNVEDPDRAFDPDCIPAQADGICDPDTNGVEDGTCDQDCLQRSDICDPDCGNDRGCVCDGECNGYCSVKCLDEIIYPDIDPDCIKAERGTPCCGDSTCDFSEDCQSCGDDCPPLGGCGGLGSVCCPQDNTKDEFGCSSNSEIEEGLPCKCDVQCAGDMVCSPGEISGKFCCPKGRKWDGKICKMEAEVLIAALKGPMKAVYSDTEIQSLEKKIAEYQEVLSQERLGSIFMYLDQDETSDVIGSKVEDTTKSSQIQAVLEQLLPKVKAKFLIIIGGDRAFPQIDLPVGSCNVGDGHSIYQTDDFYADYRPKDNMPDIPIGRIPDPNNGDIQVLLRALDNFINLHKAGGLDLSDYQSTVMWIDDQGNGPLPSGACAHEAIFNVGCNQDPRCTFRGNYQTANAKEFFMVLVHGGDATPQVFRDSALGFQMTSLNMPEIEVKNALWFVMACYGGMIDNKDTRQDSMVMQFLYEGGAVYLGGTRTQLGKEFDGSNCGIGDGLIGTFYTYVGKQFAVGRTIGDAFREGKKQYASASNERCSDRTAHQTLLYGDPTLKIKRLWYEVA